jgi:hypothetical protein
MKKIHWKSRKKLIKADRVYLTTESSKIELAYQARIKLPTEEYVFIELHLDFPIRVEYRSLKNGGFNYKPEIDPPMRHNSKQNTIRILTNSKNYRNNNPITIDRLISLIKDMQEF